MTPLTPTQLQALADWARTAIEDRDFGEQVAVALEQNLTTQARLADLHSRIDALIQELAARTARLAEVEEALEGVANDWGCWCTDLWRATHDHVDDPDHSPACVAVRQAVGHE